MTPRHVVAFRAGTVLAAAPADQVEAILPAMPLLSAPDAPDWLLGLLVAGPEVRAVVDVARRLFRGRGDAGASPHFLALRSEGLAAVLAVTEVEGVLRVEEEAVAPPEGLPESTRGLFLSAVRAGGAVRVVLDVRSLLRIDREALAAAAGRGSAGAAGEGPASRQV